MSHTVAVDALRVGMYIHLEGGWLSHPFPLSSFRIASAEQVAALQRLGVARLRWSPDRSDPAPADDPGAAATDDAGGATPSGDAAAAAGTRASTPADPPPSAATAEARRRRQLLAEQRDAQRRCEAQHAEAAAAWRATGAAIDATPLDAGRAASALAAALSAKMLDGAEVGLRLIHGGGDRAASHALNVAVISLLIGRSMALDADELADLGVGALMHDVGQLELPERLRHVDESAAATGDAAAWRDHVGRGVAQGRRMRLSPGALAVLAQHHEHADGNGFPQRLTVDRMTLAARIVAIVDRYDRLCAPASGAAGLTPHEAVATLFAGGRTRFDAAVLNAFIRAVGVYPAGSLVQLTDDRHALVVGINASRPLKPRVLVHDAQRPASEALLLDLEAVPDLGIRRSLPPSRVPPQALAYLDPTPRACYAFESLSAPDRPQALAA